jgi:DNA invertase Pin-like site-specific DNA recombinase
MSRRVAIYARVSTEHEAQLSALENQIQYYDELLKRHPEWDLYDRYIDEGITGTSIKKRKNFMRMMKDAEDGKFDLIVTREVSRFARNTVDTLQETRKLKKIGVEVYFTEDNIWTFHDDDGELKLTIMATLAQNESKKTSQRVKAGQKISFQNGVYYGSGNVMGYDRIGKDAVINEEQAEVVKLIFKLFLDGYGTQKINYELEKRGIPTATGLKTWSFATISRMLQNPFYCGTVVYRKEYTPDFLEQKKKKNKGEVEQIIVEGKHTPIISKEVFEQVQKIIKSHSTIKPEQK